MLTSKDKVIVALSGGKDSMTLLYNLIRIQESKYQVEPPIALTIDEGIEGYRKKSIELAKKFCQEHEIELKIISFKDVVGKSLDEIIKVKKKAPDYRYGCNYCATIRRRLLNEGAKELGGTILALGHNLTDITETFLMNILHKRLQLISNQYLFKKQSVSENKIFVKKITPLMRIPEEEIYLYANISKLNYYASHCSYRDKDPILRKRVLDFIQQCKKFSPEIEFNLFNSFHEISELLYKNRKINKSINCKICGYPSGKSDTCIYCKLVKEIN